MLSCETAALALRHSRSLVAQTEPPLWLQEASWHRRSRHCGFKKPRGIGVH